jgi:hypothetical protein
LVRPGTPDACRARAVLRHLTADGRRSTAEALCELRRAFPNAPLSVRLAALAELGAPDYIPR